MNDENLTQKRTSSIENKFIYKNIEYKNEITEPKMKFGNRYRELSNDLSNVPLNVHHSGSTHIGEKGNEL